MKEHRRIRLAYIGDDFTGSTDALERLSLAGARTALFLRSPVAALLERYRHLDAFGVAATTRAMTPPAMEAALTPVFKDIKTINPRHVHYKICSTFDSSPEIGSIGKAIETGAAVFGPDFVPVLPAAPDLGRYCAFGNLFAKAGAGGFGAIYRLDRHPTMSRHPVTPADESDLRLHLGRQTNRKIGLFDLLDLNLPLNDALQRINAMVEHGVQIVLIDALYENQMAAIGRIIDAYAAPGQPLFSVGSSGIERALGDYWNERKIFKPRVNWPDPGKKAPLLAVSGSCSPVTASQIRYAIAQGFAGVAVNESFDAADVHDVRPYVKKTAALLRDGKNVIVHTCLGPDDQRLAANREGSGKTGSAAVQPETSKRMGEFLGRLLKQCLEQVALHRVAIAGGDTSGYTAGELGIVALEMIAPLVNGAPLCRAFAPGSPADGLEMNFKGGQVGDERYFEYVLNGKSG